MIPRRTLGFRARALGILANPLKFLTITLREFRFGPLLAGDSLSNSGFETCRTRFRGEEIEFGDPE
jgi:hypothetical protein